MLQISQSLRTGEVKLVEVPAPLVRPGHVVVAVTRSLVSLGTERMLLSFGQASWLNKARQQPEKVRQVLRKVKTDGLKPTLETVKNKLDRPIPLGYSAVGQVLEVGSGVEGLSPGDRVVCNGPHAEVVCVPENLCAKVPLGVADEVASFTVVAAIALQGIRLAAPTLGETFAVQGLGLIGLLALQLLKANGCRVLGFDPDPGKVEIARSLGADAYCLGEGADPTAHALQATGGAGLDGVIIAASTKSSEPVHQAADMCRKRARIVLVGVVGLELSRADFYEKELSFQVSCSYGPGRYETPYEQKGLDYPIGFVRWTEQRNFNAVLELMAAGQIDVTPLITREVAFAEAEEVYAGLAREQSLLGLVFSYPERSARPSRTIILRPSETRQDRVPCVGVLGAGNFAGGVLIPALAKAGARLDAIASAGGHSARYLGDKFDFGFVTSESESLIGSPSVNTVVITTRHADHAEHAVAALRAGKHVFVEKPLALDLPSFERVQAAYQAAHEGGSGPLLMVGFNRRFSPLVKRAKALLAGRAGPLALIYTVNAGAIPANHWTQDREIGGGRLLGEACHFVDLLRFFVDKPITGATLTEAATGTRDVATLSLEFEDGSIGSVHYFANGHKAFPKERLEVFGEGRVLAIDNFRSLSGEGWGRKALSHKLRHQDKGHQAEIEAFLSAIRAGGPPPIPPEELFEVTRVMIDLVEGSVR